MPAVASEVSVISSQRAFQPQRTGTPADDAETPFAALLESNEPPPQRSEHGRSQDRDSAPAQNAASTPDRSRNKPAASKPATQKAASDKTKPAENSEAAEVEVAPEVEVKADGEAAKAVAEFIAAIEPQVEQPDDPVEAETENADTEAPAAESVAVVVTPAPSPTVATDAAGSTDDIDLMAAAKPAVPTVPDAPETPELAADGEVPVENATPAEKTPPIAPQLTIVEKPKAQRIAAAASAPDKSDGVPVDDVVAEAPAAAEDGIKPAARADDAPGQQVKAAPDHRETDHASEKQAAQTETNAKPQAADTDARPEAPRTETAARPAIENAPAVTAPSHQAIAQAQNAAQNSTQTAQANAVPVAGIAVEIAAQSRAGKNRFEIRLDPPELGRIDVRLEVDRNGHVTSRLIVERSETLDLLRRDAPQLERALEQAGLKTSDNGLQFSLRDQSPQQQNDEGQRRTAQLVIPDADIPNTPQTPYRRLTGIGSGVDIRI